MMNSGLTSRRLRDLLRLCAPRKREGERILAATTTTLAPNHTLQFSSFTYSNSSAPKANIIIRGRLHKLQINSQLQRASSDMSFCFWDRGEKFKDHFEPGVYVCSKCGYELFSSKQKFDHHSPWPAFTKTIHSDSVTKNPESRTALKVKCGKCGNPLGHEFLGDGPEGASRF